MYLLISIRTVTQCLINYTKLRVRDCTFERSKPKDYFLATDQLNAQILVF